MVNLLLSYRVRERQYTAVYSRYISGAQQFGGVPDITSYAAGAERRILQAPRAWLGPMIED